MRTTPDGDLERAHHDVRFARATAAYVSGLAKIADLSTLSTGSHEYDYAVTVPQDE